MLLAVDPGASAGWALFALDTADGPILTACGLGASSFSVAISGPFLTQIVIEEPRIYPGGRTRDPNALIKVAIDVGRWLGHLDAVVPATAPRTLVAPREWKGQVPKEIHNARTLAKLLEYERLVLDRVLSPLAPSKRHNVIDAVGLGLWAVGR